MPITLIFEADEETVALTGDNITVVEKQGPKTLPLKKVPQAENAVVENDWRAFARTRLEESYKKTEDQKAYHLKITGGASGTTTYNVYSVDFDEYANALTAPQNGRVDLRPIQKANQGKKPTLGRT